MSDTLEIPETVLGIDPGPNQSGYVVWSGKTIWKKGIVPNNEMGNVIVQHVGPVACEMIASYGMPVGAEVFETVLWIGRFIECRAGLLTRILRHEVKMHLCHNMRAKDGNIRQALIDRFGAPGTKKAPGLTYGLTGHMWAAFAVAVTHFDKRGLTQ